MKTAQDYFQQGHDYQAIGEMEKARLSYELALSLEPGHVNALNYLGVMEAEGGDAAKAVARFSWVVLLCDFFAPFQFNLANALFGSENYLEAEVYYSRCLELDGLCVLAYYRRGLSRHFSNKNKIAAKDVMKSIIIEPRSDEFYLHLGIISQSLDLMGDAEKAYRASGILNPKNSSARNNYGALQKNADRPEKAFDNYIPALCSSPGFYDAWYNLAGYYDELPDAPAALRFLERALSIRGEEINAIYNYSLYLLKSSRFSDAWQRFGVRWKASGFRSQKVTSIRPFWTPDDARPRVLIWGEQGIGDQILFSSILPEVESRASVVIIAVKDKLVEVFKRSFPTAIVVSHETIPSYHDYDYHLAMGDLGVYFRRSIESFPNIPVRYLYSDINKKEEFRARLPINTLVCGISWHSSRAAVGLDKSVDLEQWLPILSIAGIIFVNLQYGDVDEELSRFKTKNNINIYPFSDVDKFGDVDSLTSLVDMCDFVITVSNTTAHIAGALAKNTILLAPSAKGKIWYWGNRREHYSLWYPSIKIIEQGLDRSWKPAIDGAKEHILLMQHEALVT